jgi:hypothetical protein
VTESSIALASLVHRLRTHFDGLQETVTRHAAQLADLVALAQLMQEHMAAEEERAATQSAPVWVGLSQGEYDAQLTKLAAFVDQHLRVAYRDYLEAVLHDCWSRHPAALWELGNLWAEWNRIYDRSQPSLSGALAWHDRWLPGVKSRLTDIMRGCRADRCSKDSTPITNGWGAR